MSSQPLAELMADSFHSHKCHSDLERFMEVHMHVGTEMILSSHIHVHVPNILKYVKFVSISCLVFGHRRHK